MQGWALSLAAALSIGLVGCGGEPVGPDTRQLGAREARPAVDQLVPIPLPRGLPPRTSVQLASVGDDAALAVWVEDGTVLAAGYERGAGWTAPLPLEDIYGVATDVQLASSGRGTALALWRHTVGRIESLRFSRYVQGLGWSEPDVLPGALPRPRVADAVPGLAGPNAPRLQMDALGNAIARWPSGFAPAEVQVARYLADRGWTRPQGEPVAAAPSLPPPAR